MGLKVPAEEWSREEVCAIDSGIQLRELGETDFDPELWEATDDVHENKSLDLRRAREARAEEMTFIKNIGVYRYASAAETWKVTGTPIGVRWVDQDRGERYRARLCAMEFRRKSEATWFAGTPSAGEPAGISRDSSNESSARTSQ